MSGYEQEEEYSRKLIDGLESAPFQGESDYINDISTSHLVVEQNGQPLHMNDSIYYLLNCCPAFLVDAK